MARKRMFDSEIINQDSFFDLPMEAKALYFLLGMEADDEGFVSPKKVLRLYGGTDDSIRILALKNFIIPFESGVIVITDWKNNNWLDNRRTKTTIYQEEKKQIFLNEETGKYELLESSNTNCLANAKQMLRENRIEENRIEENSIVIAEANDDIDIIKSIVEYLNNRANTNFRYNSNSTQKNIKARLKDGYTYDDFVSVIDKQANKWIGTEWEQYLRPSTLFSPKNFENYLNAPAKVYKEQDDNKATGNPFFDLLKKEGKI